MSKGTPDPLQQIVIATTGESQGGVRSLSGALSPQSAPTPLLDAAKFQKDVAIALQHAGKHLAAIGAAMQAARYLQLHRLLTKGARGDND